MKVQGNVTARGEEPPMFLQRPSTGKSQDVRHILTRTFRDLYTRDAIGAETVRNLNVSKGGDDPYHERYVESLQKVFEERQKRLDEAAKLEKHIMQAQARAMSADERELNKNSQSCDNYNDLGLPPGRSHFRSCIDTDLLRKNKLLTPEDYATEEASTVPPPPSPKIPSYARETVSSRQHTRMSEVREHSPFPQRTDLEDFGGPTFLSDDFQEGALESSRSDIEITPRSPNQHGWKRYMSEEQREQDRQDLANLQSKVNYKRNPRYVAPSASPGGRTLIKGYNPSSKEIGIKPDLGDEKKKEPSLIFLVSPPIVKFTNYKSGQVYELTLELKNVSAVLRQCRALPPTTSYFSIGLGQFPGEHGLVAPGMSCHYAVRFAPDSLKDYDDEIRIQTQSSSPIIVPVQGRRQPPKLTLPKVLDIGYCLVGGYQVVQFIVKNQGGSGRFCIMNRSSWPAHNFKSVVTNGSVSLPPFDVRPSVLELMKGESGVLEVVFSPKAVRHFSQEMTLVCDNCNVRHFLLQGEAQKAGVELVSVERGTSDPLPGEMTDNTAQHLIRFDDLNPFTYTDRAIIIKNPTNVPLPFQWSIYKPDMSEPEDPEGKKKDKVPDVDSVFSVHPPNGTLPPAAEMEFKITFAPPVMNEFHSVLHMQLQQVPPFSEGGSAKSSKGGRSEPGDEDDDDNVSEIFLNSDVKESRDYTALEVEVKGSSIPLNVVLHPYAIYIPGQNLVGTTIKKLFAMANHSRSTITFTWQPCNDQHILEVEPPFGELDPGMAMDMEISVTGSEPGKVSETLYCYVMNLDEPLHLHVEADFKGPELRIDDPDINYGLVRLGQSITKEITLTNMSQIITKWSIQDSPVFSSSEDPMAVSEFTFTPSSGEIQPLGQTRVSIKFTPTSVKSIKRVFEVSVEDGNECNISAFGEVQSPMVCLSSCEICMEDVFKQVPVRYQAVLVNQTLLATEFKWGEIEGEHAKDCSIELDPVKGFINPREEKSITINFVTDRSGEFSDLRIPCFVEGLSAPLYLGLFADVKGLSASYKMSTDGTDQEVADKLDFGEALIGSTPKLFLHVRNESAISAHYSISADYFVAKPPTPPTDKASHRSTRKSLLNKTPNLADPMSKTSSKAKADLCQAMLMQGLGAAFVALPATGTLQPFGQEMIEITAYSDMWGSYTDELKIKVGDLDTHSIPVCMNVIGCPLNFQMTAAKHEQKPVVRFGTHVSGVAPINRSMRINNISPYDIRCDWETYNVEDGDNKLLDIMVAFGNPFPRRNNKGAEIIPPWQTPEPIQRQPTDMIPDTADSSPFISRDHSKYSIRSGPIYNDDEEEGNLVEEPEVPVTPQLKVVSLYYRAHEGVPAQEPYNIKAKQVIIPARGFANVNITFTPLSTDHVTQEMDCVGFAIAHMSIDKNANVENKVVRKQGYEVNPLHLDMTAHLKPALLNMECRDEEGMRYRSAMSDLMLDRVGNTHSESFRIMGAVLSNQTETPLAFRLITKPPFLLVDLDPSTNQEEMTRAYVTEFQTLRPQHNLPVKVAFQTTTDLLKYLNDTEYGHVTLREQDGKKIDINDDLVVEFSNGTTQKLPLCATLSVPQMELSKESLDFGTCLVGQQRELQLMISNRTASHCHWRVYLDSTSSTSTHDTFCLQPGEGYLEAHITHISDSKCLLKVFFTAKHAEHYEAVFVFRGNLGEEQRKLFVRGKGSYDEKHEAILNV